MAIRDKHVDWNRVRLYIPILGVNGYSVDILVTGGQGAGDAVQILPTGSDPTVIGKTTATNRQAVGAVAGTDRNARLRAIGNGNPRVVPIVGTNMAGLLLVTANDGVEFCGPIPSQIDVDFEIGVRAFWTSEAAAVGARTITFAVTYGKFAVDAVLAAGATALDTVIAAQAPKGTSLALQEGNRGVINANKFGKTDRLWSFKVLMSAFDAAFTENKYLLGVELDYIPRLTKGSGKRTDASLATNPLDDN